MKHLIRAVALAATLAATLAALAPVAPAHAQVPSSYPTRPITMNVPYAAGGPLDVMARSWRRGWGKRSGRPS